VLDIFLFASLTNNFAFSFFQTWLHESNTFLLRLFLQDGKVNRKDNIYSWI
jgi:hypothetical protein